MACAEDLQLVYRCPGAGCGRCIFIDPDINPDSLLQAVAAGKGLDVRCTCGQDFCFSCLGVHHEPASCDAVSLEPLAETSIPQPSHWFSDVSLCCRIHNRAAFPETVWPLVIARGERYEGSRCLDNSAFPAGLHLLPLIASGQCFSDRRQADPPAGLVSVQRTDGLQAKQWGTMIKEAETEMSEAWLEQNSKPCGKCGAPIQKSGGCNHMICIKCHYHFCWVSRGSAPSCQPSSSCSILVDRPSWAIDQRCARKEALFFKGVQGLSGCRCAEASGIETDGTDTKCTASAN